MRGSASLVFIAQLRYLWLSLVLLIHLLQLGGGDRRAGEISIAAAQAQESKSAPAYLGGVTSLQALVP